MNAELQRAIPGIVWNFSQNIRDNVMEALSGVKGDNSLKIFGPDLDQLELLADEGQEHLAGRPGNRERGHLPHPRTVAPGVPRRSGEVPEVGRARRPTSTTSSAAPWAPRPCPAWSRARSCSTSPCAGPSGGGPARRRSWTSRWTSSTTRWSWHRARASRPTPAGMPCLLPRCPAAWPTRPTRSAAPRESGWETWSARWARTDSPDPNGQFERPGSSTIYREQGKRLIAIKFSVRGRDLGSAVDEAKVRTKELFKIPYRAVWSGEFEEMEEADGRLMCIIPLSLGLIFILLYSAFRSFLDTIVVFSNVFDLAVGGIWALVLDRDQLQHLGGRRLRVALRRGHHGRPAADLVLQRPSRPGPAAHGSHHAGCRQTGAAGDDDRADGHPGSLAGGRLDQDRCQTHSRWPSWWSAA